MNIFALALGPVVALLFFFWVKDRYERDPLKYLLITLGAGVVSAIPVVVVEMLWVLPSYEISALTTGELAFVTFVAVGLTEEFFKALAFFIPVYWSKHFNEPYDGIMYGVAAALGFAGIENVMYVLMGGVPAAFIRAITAVPAHAMFGLFIGYFAGRAKFAKRKWVKPFLILTGFLIAVFLHGLYDLIAMWPYHHLAWLWLFPLLAVMVVVSLLLIRNARNRSPFKPAKDEFGRYTGYTVSGQPLSPKIAAKLGVEPQLPPPDYVPPEFIQSRQKPSVPEPEVRGHPARPETKAQTPYFLDEYFEPARNEEPPAVIEPLSPKPRDSGFVPETPKEPPAPKEIPDTPKDRSGLDKDE
jgi:RsiW-degrading membrane proteinase PrsW (M82 family)